MPEMPETAPVLSVIVPSYKVRDYVADCVRSLFRQTLREPFEIIVVDDCDPEHSVEEVHKIEPEKPAHITLRYLAHEHNRGLSAARNTGTAAATAGFVLYVDSDDELYPRALQLLLDEARRTGADVTVGVTRQNPPLKGKELRAHSEGFLSGEEAFDAYMAWEIDMTAWNKLVKRDFLERHGIRFREGFIHEDEIWSVDLLVAGVTFACWDGEPTYFYRSKRPGSIMSVANVNRFRPCLRFCNEVAATLDTAGYGNRSTVHHRLAGAVHGALLEIYQSTPHAGIRSAWTRARKIAAALPDISPALRRHMLLGGIRMCNALVKLLALPWGVRQSALFLYLLYLSKRIGSPQS